MPKRKGSQRKPGRPVSLHYKDVKRRAITTQWPEPIIEAIDAITDNRTQWLIAAAKEKLAAGKKEERE